MITVVDEQLRQEARAFHFRFTCEHCVLFNDETGRCSHDYPNLQHKEIDLEREEQVVFCKEFEFG